MKEKLQNVGGEEYVKKSKRKEYTRYNYCMFISSTYSEHIQKIITPQ